MGSAGGARRPQRLCAPRGPSSGSLAPTVVRTDGAVALGGRPQPGGVSQGLGGSSDLSRAGIVSGLAVPDCETLLAGCSPAFRSAQEGALIPGRARQVGGPPDGNDPGR